MLSSLPYTPARITRQISGENPTGAAGGACRFDPARPEDTLDGGLGLKVHPFLQLQPGETRTLADIEGPGCVTQIFFTTDHCWLSELVLRIYWDGEAEPSVECPVGAFFANGFDGDKHLVSSAPVAALPRNAYNCYWAMPFHRRCTITLEHQGDAPVGCVAYRVLYQLYPIGEDAAYFHAAYRRSVTSLESPTHTILDGVAGQGNYVGTYLAWNALSSSWWGEGEVKFYLDGDTAHPTLADNGAEDYFGGSFGFSPFNSTLCGDAEQPFSTAWLGMPLARLDRTDAGRRYSLYRWHVLDPIGFFSDIRVTVDTLGWWRKPGCRPLAEDISSVAFWYQAEPHRPLPPLPPKEARWDR